MAEVNKGDVVQIHYTGRLEDGSVFDSSQDREPLRFVAGSGQLIPGVSEAVLGMQEGEKKTVTVPPDKGYGLRNPALQQTVPRGDLPDQVAAGDQLRAVHQGKEFPVWVSEVNDQTAKIDANHPLAGKTLTFDLEVVSVAPAAEG
jgi:peptidylprolyl isomerase